MLVYPNAEECCTSGVHMDPMVKGLKCVCKAMSLASDLDVGGWVQWSLHAPSARWLYTARVGSMEERDDASLASCNTGIS